MNPTCVSFSSLFVGLTICLCALAESTRARAALLQIEPSPLEIQSVRDHREVPNDPWMPPPISPPAGAVAHCGPWVRGPYASIQVNVDESGCNIPGDAANEPSLAFDPTNFDRFVMGWRQFDSVESDFTQAGYAHSHDRGATWSLPGTLAPGTFGSDPVLAADPDGVIYYLSINSNEMRLFTSFDAGVTWSGPNFIRTGLRDKPWMAIDQTSGPGRGNIYISWRPQFQGRLIRSTDHGATFVTGIDGDAECGTIAIGLKGEVYVSGADLGICQDSDASDSSKPPSLDRCGTGFSQLCLWAGGFNPDGLAGHRWVAVDHSNGQGRGNVYTLLGTSFQRSLNRGGAWSPAVRVDDDPTGAKWFGTLSVAPNGRIDVVWNDTRDTGSITFSELFYTSSRDGGLSWNRNVAVSPAFDSTLGWPGGQRKIGDYYHMISLDDAAYLAYSATFNGEQDVYLLRIPADDCDGDGVTDVVELTADPPQAPDCSGNGLPDNCEPDCNHNGIADSCDILAGTHSDCTGNGVPDDCEPDCNNNGISDRCEIQSGTSADCNRNGSPDLCDVQAGLDDDCNNNQQADGCEIDDRTAGDCDLSGVLEACNNSSWHYGDCNHNCVSDHNEIRFPIAATTFATGFEVPQDIVPSQGDFSPGFFVTEYWGSVKHVSPDGQMVTTYVDGLPNILIGATMVPDEFGGEGVRLAVVASGNNPHSAHIFLIKPDRSVAPLVPGPQCDQAIGVVYVPNSVEGDLGNHLLLGCWVLGEAQLYAVGSGGASTLVASSFAHHSSSLYGLARNVGAFGDHSGRVLGSNGQGNLVYYIDGSWLKPLIRVPNVSPTQTAILRQISFSPPDWAYFFSPELKDQSVLVVSRAGGTPAGTQGGAVQLWDSNGRLIAQLTKNPSGGTIDPRGTTFDGDALLIADIQSRTLLRATLKSFSLSDCDTSLRPDLCEAFDPSVDCNSNGILDTCELSGPWTNDCNANGKVDDCEITSGSAPDCDFNRRIDTCEALDDCNENGQLDRCDAVLGNDCDNNWSPDECDSDFDSDGIPNDCDGDLDDDGVPNDLDVCRTPLGMPVDPEGRHLFDLDPNCILDYRDYAPFYRDYWLHSGPGVSLSPSDALPDRDQDTDVDLYDFALLQNYFWH